MNWIKSEKEIFDKALKAVEKTNQSLIRVYLITQKEIEAELKRFYLTVDPSWTKQYQSARLTAIFKTINIRLNALTGISIKTIEQAFLRVYQDTFNNYAYNFSSYYAVPGAFPLLPFMVNPEKTIMAALNEKIGEYSFLKSMADKQGTLRDSLREQIAIAIAKGESVAKLTKRLKGEFDSGISRYATTARTEMLKSFSIAQEESTLQALDMDIEMKFQWIAANQPGRTRASHLAMNGKFAREFTADGMPLFRVGMSKGSGPRLLSGADQKAQNINCRCRRINIPLPLTAEQEFEFERATTTPTAEQYVDMIS
jgi:hypothetical protein